jgi:hypothetical protein
MTDFITALEEQLVTAHRERRPRRFAVPLRGSIVLVATAAAVADVVAVVLALATPDTHHSAAPKPQVTVTQPAPRYDATVAVLNGTTLAGLARTAMDKLADLGFREGVVTNDASNQQRRRTEIYYEAGYRDQAQAVASCIEVGLDRIQPMTANARVLGDRADIVVLIGADKAK